MYILRRLNLKTIYFNFKYLPFKQAIRIPILISNNVYLRQVSGSIKFECPIEPFLIQIGYGNVGIFDDKKSRSIWDVCGEVIFKGRAKIGHGSKICVGSTGTLEIGENFTITAESSIVAFCKIIFGKNCLLSWDILVMDTDFHKIKDELGSIINEPQPITIGNDVWVGCRCLILKGTDIPNGCVIGAGSLVNKLLKNEHSVYVGNPIKCSKENILWEKERF